MAAILVGGPNAGTEYHVASGAEEIYVRFIGPLLPWTDIVGAGEFIYTRTDRTDAGRRVYQYLMALPKASV